jgi:hypothetical protein
MRSSANSLPVPGSPRPNTPRGLRRDRRVPRNPRLTLCVFGVIRG